MQTLKQAVHLAITGKSRDLRRAALYLDGLPAGGWGETQQAMARIAEELPFRAERAYTVSDFVTALYDVDAVTERYRTKVR